MKRISEVEARELVVQVGKDLEGKMAVTGMVVKELIEKYGFTEARLGSTNKILSRQVTVRTFSSRKYLNGKFLAVGLASTLYGGHSMYRALVIEVQ